jgi:RNA polymerase sigma factor (sigma-70 family)
MLNPEETSRQETSDADLVGRSLAGNRDAFGLIVARYQTLICSLAYSATGSLAGSEDLSQDTFLAAWKQLPELREPGKLRSWLCGIARNLGRRLRRSQRHEPVHGAQDMDCAHEVPAVEPLPRDQAISMEEEAILWRSLERIPDSYREPLILYYREHQSVERVAQVLDLSEDAVRQRLSRGKKLLHEEVAAFVEGALLRSAPGSAFAGSVIAALPVNGAGVAAGVGAAKGGGLLSILTIPVLGLLASLAGSMAIVRDSATPGERQSKKRLFIWMWIAGAGLWMGLLLSRFLRGHWGLGDTTFVGSQVACYLLWAVIVTPLVVVFVRRHSAIHPGARPARAASCAATPRLSGLFTVGAMTFGAIASLIHVAWQVGDSLAAGTTAAVGAVVMAWSLGCVYFPGFIDKIGISRQRLVWVPTLLIAGVILLVLNGRLDRWIAVVRGGGLDDAHRFLPMWVVHLSTLGVLIWAAVVVVATGPKAVQPASHL